MLHDFIVKAFKCIVLVTKENQRCCHHVHQGQDLKKDKLIVIIIPLVARNAKLHLKPLQYQ